MFERELISLLQWNELEGGFQGIGQKILVNI